MEYVYTNKRENLSREFPPGHIRIDEGDGRGTRGVAVYAEPLSAKMMLDWQLKLVDLPRVLYGVYGVMKNGNHEYLGTCDTDVLGIFEWGEKQAIEQAKYKGFIDYVIKPRS